MSSQGRQGGICNDFPEGVEIGGRRDVAAVYELPAGETGLVLVYAFIDWSTDPVTKYPFQVNIR
jgi:hypothetical protein